MATMDKFAPKATGVRDPRDPKMKNGMFFNPPRYLTYGGKGPETKLNMAPGQNAQGPKINAAGPISDRGRGGRR